MSELPTTPNKSSRQGSVNLCSSINGSKRRFTTSPSSRASNNNNNNNNSNGTVGSRLSLDGKLSRIPFSNANTNVKSSTGSNLTSFYKQQIRELNSLQEELYVKKSKLDTLKDQYEMLNSTYKEKKLKWDKLYLEKQNKQNQLSTKKKEIEVLNDKNDEKIKQLKKGHELHMEQLKIKNQGEINKLQNEYLIKINQLKHQKEKKFQDERDNLQKEVIKLERRIDSNDAILNDLLNDLKIKYDKLKETWLIDYQNEWKQNIEKNERYSNEINDFKLKLGNDLTPRIEKLNNTVNNLENEITTLNATLIDKKRESETLKTKTIETNEKIRNIEAEKAELVEFIKTSNAELIKINECLTHEETVRRQLHNKLQELRGNIRVYCRLRPPLKSIEDPNTSHIKVYSLDNDHGTQTMEITKNNNTNKYKFDKIFDQFESNSEIFKEVGQLVQSALDGYNVCIFAYGQTGSGKTFTMLNPSDGIIPSTVRHIFTWIDNLKERGWEYQINCQFVEIYNENIIDLLREKQTSQKHDIRHDDESQTTSITNVMTVTLDREETVEKVLHRATKLRSTASTKSNEHSSRSHSIFIIHLHGKNSKTNEDSYGILNLVDLAGSERINSSQVSGERLRETQHINKSLSCLGDVIHALNSSEHKERHIPFRNSKLTHLLKYSLSGNSKTLMFVNISASLNHVNETINSLRFASKVNSTKMMKT
ncbi:hypothetical protein KAFR_0B06590 [Kazachstania africana CBS 2517]|uniref:Kinesin motor domain-containing protein n=1 Tax=Kazachstania africana (strain ATCC 22294 / BCRC 22015 / CBS 2517 / CECT 1963 / NBRC 1671 / NRRL Y-8276) TaxID=1071382 RepID=H2ARF5_KAZAF|nr:hypothetical protein KAFR_0B06590 [Kazachstania africana CBS 2517]CCF56955.1 hypothetical protein KAFR_0B06590 [Kazachstania africana CBS 2517]